MEGGPELAQTPSQSSTDLLKSTSKESGDKSLEAGVSASAYVLPAAPTNRHDAAGLAVAEEQYIIPKAEGYERKTTTRGELLSYYLYYAGNSGLSNGIMAPGLMQSYMYDYAYDPSIVPHVPGNCSDVCYLDWGGGSKPLTSVVLDASGIQFAIQLAIALVMGGWLDYTKHRKEFVMVTTCLVGIIVMMWLTVKDGSQWQAGVGIGIASQVCYYLSFAYFQAAMPGLARDTKEIQQAEQDVLDGNMAPGSFSEKLMLMRNRIGNLGYTVCGFGPFLICLPAIGFIYRLLCCNFTGQAMHPNESGAANERAYRIILAYYAAALLVCCAPWFYFEQKRAPAQLPPGTSIWTVGFKNYWQTAKHILKLKQTMLYLAAVIFLSEAVNTTSTITYNLQYSISSYDLPTTNYMTLMSYGVQGCGTWIVYWVQQHFKLSTKTMLQMTSAGSLLCIIWGFIGIWTPNFGFKNLWEIWLFNAWFGFAMCPYFQIAWTMIAEVAPPTKIYMFWSFFALFGKASAFSGPFITSAIIERAGGNGNAGYAFLLPMILIGMAILYFVDTDKSALECKAFLEAEARQVYHTDGLAHYGKE